MNNTIQLYTDDEKQSKGYPVTTPDRVVYENGKTVKDKLKNNVKYDVVGQATAPSLNLGYDDREIREEIDKVYEQIDKGLSYVTPEMFGAKGDGTTDDTDAFIKAFNSGKAIICKQNTNYYFSKVINARQIKQNTKFDGNYATFINFRLEISLKDDEYDWRWAYSPNRLEMINCIFGIENDNREQSYNKPVVISGMTVIMENIILKGRLVLLAYPDRYVDVLHMKNIIKMNNQTFNDCYNYNAVMRIRKNGELIEYGNESAGDSWLFIGCNEFRSNITSGDGDNIKRYGLVSLYNNTATFIECIQSTTKVATYCTANFIGCHYEESYVYLGSSTNNTIIKFDSCYFYGKVIPKVNNKMTFINCMFRFGYGTSFNYQGGNSILKNANVINCRFGDSGLISNTSELHFDIGCNYKGDDFEEYGLPSTIQILNSSQTNGSFTGETTITFYGKRLEANYYAFKVTKTINLTGVEKLMLKSYCKTPMIFEFYIENQNKIYKGTTKTIDSCDSVEIHVFNNFFTSYVKYRKEAKHICYPPSDTLEIVETLPKYTESTTLYRISKGLCIDISDSPVSNIPRFAIISKDNVKAGNMW